MYNRLDSIPACDRRTDILPRHIPRYAHASRGKNGAIFLLHNVEWCDDERSLMICLAASRQSRHVTDRRTDGQTVTESQLFILPI